MSDPSYDPLFRELHEKMMQQSFLVENPMLALAKQKSEQAPILVEALRQYVRLPEEIVGFLKAAAGHFPKSRPLALELERNWQQEQGSETGGVPHVELLKRLLQRDVGINANHVSSSPVTKTFLTTIEARMKRSVWFAIGQVYALEATAVPELAILVGPLINACARMTNQVAPVDIKLLQRARVTIPRPRNREEAFQLTMNDWLAMHILDFEVGHRDLLRKAIVVSAPSAEEQKEFIAGFQALLEAMDGWWKGLALGA